MRKKLAEFKMVIYNFKMKWTEIENIIENLKSIIVFLSTVIDIVKPTNLNKTMSLQFLMFELEFNKTIKLIKKI